LLAGGTKRGPDRPKSVVAVENSTTKKKRNLSPEGGARIAVAVKRRWAAQRKAATHKHARVQRWLNLHKRFHVRFTPTSASWLKMIEPSFRDLTQNRLKRGVFQDLEQLITAIGNHIDVHNQNPKPFIWTAKASDILGKVTRAQTAINKRPSV
jgi:hypothetical protein